MIYEMLCFLFNNQFLEFDLQIMEMREAVEEAATSEALLQIQSQVLETNFMNYL